MTSFDIPLRRATAESLSGYGELVSDPEARPVEIVPWPAPGRRPLDPGTGDQGGTTEGIFEFWWSGDVLEGRNNAVDDQYVLGWTRNPEAASREEATVPRSQVLLWHANYHPDGGQLFFPLD
nr:ureidoglycolate hydrolase [Kiloniellales bacterium]